MNHAEMHGMHGSLGVGSFANVCGSAKSRGKASIRGVIASISGRGVPQLHLLLMRVRIHEWVGSLLSAVLALSRTQTPPLERERVW